MAPDGVHLRRAGPDDAEPLTYLHLDVWDDAYAGLIEQRVLDARRPGIGERVDRWRESLADARSATWLAEGTAGLVGFASSGVPRDEDVDLESELYALYVRRASYGTGVGFALLERAVADRPCYLWVLRGN